MPNGTFASILFACIVLARIGCARTQHRRVAPALDGRARASADLIRQHDQLHDDPDERLHGLFIA